MSSDSHRLKLQTARRICDGLTEALLYGGVVFAPWAFGTTQLWSLWVMNGLGYALGLLLLLKWGLAWRGGFRPQRWSGASRGLARFLTGLMAVLTVVLLAYCLVGALNPRASRIGLSWSIQYHECIPWLPHSYDRGATWLAFWSYLGLALGFWAARDWLFGLTSQEELEQAAAEESAAADAYGAPVLTIDDADSALPTPHSALRVPRSDALGTAHATAESDVPPSALRPLPSALPSRLYRLLCVLCLNASLVAAQAIVQRLSGSDRLLWVLQPRFTDAGGQFGPFAYRGNACQYLNLVWPVCAGLAWVQAWTRRHARRHGLHWKGLNPAWFAAGAVLMAAAPFVSTSRGGVLVAIGLALLTGLLLASANRGRRWPAQVGLVLLVLIAAQLAFAIGFDNLMDRFESMFTDNLGGRGDVYENAPQMAKDHPWLGSGPGSFATLYQFYRASDTQAWEAYLHNDWLELRITWGWIGFGLILVLLAAVPLRWCFDTGPPVHWILPATLFAALLGCLAHARFDFPFCVYSICSTFILLCAIFGALGRRGSAE